jgi:hypothetical protein
MDSFGRYVTKTVHDHFVIMSASRGARRLWLRQRVRLVAGRLRRVGSRFFMIAKDSLRFSI